MKKTNSIILIVFLLASIVMGATPGLVLAGHANDTARETSILSEIISLEQVKAIENTLSASDTIFSREGIYLSGSSKIIGDVETNAATPGSIHFAGASKIEGDLRIGEGVDWTEVVTSTRPNPKDNVTGGIISCSVATEHPMPQFPEIPDLEDKGDLTAGWWPEGPHVIEKSGTFDKIDVTNELTINVGEQDIEIVVNNLLVSGSGRIVVNRTGKGRLILYVIDQLKLSGSGKINPSGSYDDVYTYHIGSGQIQFDGNTLFNGSIYTRDADIALSGSGSITGHIITGGNSVNLSGNTQTVSKVIYAPQADLTISSSVKNIGKVMVKSITLSGSAQIQFDDSMDLGFFDYLKPKEQKITENPKNNYVYANGNPIVIKEKEETIEGNVVKNTYIYDIHGETRLFDKPLEEVPYVFGGAQSDSVANTKVIMESGRIGTRTSTGKGYLYGGGGGDVEGTAEIIVRGGFVGSVYGCGAGTTGRVKIEYNNTVSDLQALVVGGKGKIKGDVDIVLNNPNLTTLCGGGNGTSDTYVGGNVNITIRGGNIDNLYGGCVHGHVNGMVQINIEGNTKVNKAFHPMRKIYNDLVYGGAYVYVPENFDTDRIKTVYEDGKSNNEIRIFKNGTQIYGPCPATVDSDGNIYANGTPVTIKTEKTDGQTYLYDQMGINKLLEVPIDHGTVYGGSATEDVDKTSIIMESGVVSAVYGGGRDGNVIGNSSVHLNGGAVDHVFGSGQNGMVNGTAYIKVSEGMEIAERIASDSGEGRSQASVLWVAQGFDMRKLQPGENARIFEGSFEVVDPEIQVPDTVTVRGSSVFANGIPIVVQEDRISGRTFIYDESGTKRLLTTEVNGKVIYGGSYQGVVDSTNITMESGTVARIYGGGYQGGVSDIASITVTGGDITEVIYGGSFDGDVGGTSIYVSGPYVAKGVNGGSRNGCVRGDTKVLLVDSVAKGLYAGTGGDGRFGCPSSDVMGNASYTLVGGMAESIYGGCKTGVIKGTSTITLEGQVVLKNILDAQGKGGVLGGTTVTVPENFVYMDRIEQGPGIDIQLTAPTPKSPVPEIEKRTEEVLSTEGEEGKLVFRFIELPPAEGQMMGRSGEAIFIHLPNGETMLVDAAETFTAEHLIDVLKKMQISRIDHLVASHYHSDHIGGMARILDEFDVSTLYKPGFDVNIGKDYYTELKVRIDDPDRAFSVKDLWRGDRLEIGGLYIEVLHPLDNESVKDIMNGNPTTEDHNNNSIVMKMTFGENTALLTGDIYTSVEQELLEEFGAEGLKVDLLKVPHHGDTTSSDPEFVSAVRPEIAVMNHFSETLIVSNRYKAIGSDTYVTGKDGIIKVSFDGSKNSAEVLTEYFIKDDDKASPENAE